MNYQVTGNEYVSLPTIRERDGAVEGVTFLYMGVKGLLELRGDDALIAPYLTLAGEKVPLAPAWRREHGWIPAFTSAERGVRFSCVYLAPVGERGFGVRLTAANETGGPAEVTVGLRGRWDRTLHEVNESVELEQGREVKPSGWNHMFVWMQKPGTPLFAFAPIVMDNQPFGEIDQGAEWSADGFAYDVRRRASLAPGACAVLDVFFGVGYEEVAAAASAKELLRQGFEALLDRTRTWLHAREKHLPDPRLEECLNTNLFFAFFFASGRTVDTEELCLVTSRSPRYYVSAAYWDRDALLWAFPAILSSDGVYARELLLSVFTRQGRNFGLHSRYIDGTLLEPGFELDELCAPAVALRRYERATGDHTLARESAVQAGLRVIASRLREHRHPSVALYDTFLQPTDDLRRYPYLTYDNALAACALTVLAAELEEPAYLREAEAVRRAIWTHCVREENGRRIFAWSTDLAGHADVYDEPPGSLLLLPLYGLCSPEDEVWRNTRDAILDARYPLSFAGHPLAEIGCPHAPHPWVLSICVSLLSGRREEALRHLALTDMDNGVACESVNEDTGVCETGEAFATCAGFLAFALERSFLPEKASASFDMS